MNSIFHRTSIRRYTKQKVESEKIEKILRAAMAAPSAGNQQPWEFYVVTDEETIRRLSETSPYAGFTKDAPLIIVPCYRTREDQLRFKDYAEIDLGIATEHILLEADALGLGSTWCGIAPLQDRMDAVAAVLGTDVSLRPFAIVSVGYPAEEKKQQDRYDESRIHRI